MANKKKEKTEFGQYLVDEIERAKISQTAFIEQVPMARPYFYNILTGTPPSQDVLEKIITALNNHLPPDENRRSTLIDKAAKCRGEIPPDINRMILDHTEQWDAIREMLSSLLSEPHK